MSALRTIFYACSICWLFSGCSSFLYYPSKQLFYPPSKFGLHPEEVFFPSKAGPKLFGWYFKNLVKKEPKGVVVFYHGNGENLSSHYISMIWLLEYGFDLFTFDYQGYGRSEGDPTPEGTLLDGEGALEWVSQKTKAPLLIFGQSLGGAVALRNAIDLKEKFPIRFVAVDSTFPSYKQVAAKVLSRSIFTWPFHWLAYLVMSDSAAPKNRIQEISPIPLLVIHGDKDQVVEYELGEEVFAQAKEPKEFWHIPGGTHTDVFTRQDASFRKNFVKRIEEAL